MTGNARLASFPITFLIIMSRFIGMRSYSVNTASRTRSWALRRTPGSPRDRAAARAEDETAALVSSTSVLESKNASIHASFASGAMPRHSCWMRPCGGQLWRLARSHYMSSRGRVVKRDASLSHHHPGLLRRLNEHCFLLGTLDSVCSNSCALCHVQTTQQGECPARTGW